LFRVGYGFADITPSAHDNFTLSGFIARRNRALRGIDDPLMVYALVIETLQQKLALLVYDLLALGDESVQLIDKELNDFGIPGDNRIYHCTHTHSAPATITLHGSGIVDRRYLEHVAQQSRKALNAALNNMQEVIIRHSVVYIPGCNVNRRILRRDGRVVMTASENEVAARGPDYNDFNLFMFETTQGIPFAGIIHWACHPNTVWSLKVSAEFPGELRRRMSEKYGFPFIYLQGACGNINSLNTGQTREKMIQNVDKIMQGMPEVISWGDPFYETSFRYKRYFHNLCYEMIPSIDELKVTCEKMKQVEREGLEADPASLAEVATVLGIPNGKILESKYRYVAHVISQWADTLLEQKKIPEKTDICVSLLDFGSIFLCFIAGEVFIETQLRLQNMIIDKKVIIAGYCSPLKGYIPTDEALEIGGYESAYAYRFYGHPAPFAKGTEGSLIKSIIKESSEERLKTVTG